MRKDVENIGKKLLSKNIVTGLCTNGTLINKNRAKKLVKSFDYIKVSLDGLEKNHDELRGVKGSFKKSLRGINYLFSIPERRAKIGIYFLVSEHNYEDMEKIVTMLRDRVDFINFLPVMISKNVFSDKNFVSTWKRIGLDWDIEDFIRKPTFSAGKKICDAGKLYFGIRPNGYVSVCPIKDLFLGNVKEGNILDMWHSKKIKELRDKGIDCKGCYSPCTTKVSNLFRASPTTLVKNSIKLFHVYNV
jgi:MoaA/NifB/PqqE/SkfB family radical SAM enzyme